MKKLDAAFFNTWRGRALVAFAVFIPNYLALRLADKVGLVFTVMAVALAVLAAMSIVSLLLDSLPRRRGN